MSALYPLLAMDALRKARDFLKDGQKQLARKYARRAAFLDAGLEEAWLILAGVSEPAESIYFLDRVLAINPNNARARKAFHWVSKELHKTKKDNSTKNQQGNSKIEISTSNRWAFPLFFFILSIGVFIIIGLAVPVINVQASSQNIVRPKDALFKQTLTPTITLTPTPTPTSIPTPLPTATQDTYYSSYQYHSWDIPEEVSGSNTFWIEIDLTNQILTAYRGDQIISGFLVSTGTSRYSTVTGTYKIYAKYSSYTMVGPEYNLPDVPYTMFFYKGYSIHGTYWHSNFGTPMSHGCVNMHTDDAAWVFQNAPVGTFIFIHN